MPSRPKLLLAPPVIPFPQNLEERELLAREALYGQLALECTACGFGARASVGQVPWAVQQYLQRARAEAVAQAGQADGDAVNLVAAVQGQVRLGLRTALSPAAWGEGGGPLWAGPDASTVYVPETGWSLKLLHFLPTNRVPTFELLTG